MSENFDSINCSTNFSKNNLMQSLPLHSRPYLPIVSQEGTSDNNFYAWLSMVISLSVFIIFNNFSSIYSYCNIFCNKFKLVIVPNIISFFSSTTGVGVIIGACVVLVSIIFRLSLTKNSRMSLDSFIEIKQNLHNKSNVAAEFKNNSFDQLSTYVTKDNYKENDVLEKLVATNTNTPIKLEQGT
ncbi:MAG: hypothetical protein VX335_04130 [Pseudomonadota bacterium]|nr:hypothetical protein [Pseudomonadota bacterium]